jgi:hypothetical protein
MLTDKGVILSKVVYPELVEGLPALEKYYIVKLERKARVFITKSLRITFVSSRNGYAIPFGRDGLRHGVFVV